MGSERADLGPERGLGGTDVRTDGRLEIHPCVLQDIGPLGPLPKKCWNKKVYKIVELGLKTIFRRDVEAIDRIQFGGWHSY